MWFRLFRGFLILVVLARKFSRTIKNIKWLLTHKLQQGCFPTEVRDSQTCTNGTLTTILNVRCVFVVTEQYKKKEEKSFCKKRLFTRGQINVHKMLVTLTKKLFRTSTSSDVQKTSMPSLGQSSAAGTE